MRQTRMLMGMPITVEVASPGADEAVIDEVFDYFGYIDRKFSTYKPDSEISRINLGELMLEDSSEDMKTIFALSEQTRLETGGYFDICRRGKFDPSGIVKGWAIFRAAELIRAHGYSDYYVDAGGDMQVAGRNPKGQPWRIGIQNPFDPMQVVKIVTLQDGGVATSGTYVRGMHIYDPHADFAPASGMVSLTVIGPDIFDADRFATAAFAMGLEGIEFIERLDGFEGYMIDPAGKAWYTSGFERVVVHDPRN